MRPQPVGEAGRSHKVVEYGQRSRQLDQLAVIAIWYESCDEGDFCQVPVDWKLSCRRSRTLQWKRCLSRKGLPVAVLVEQAMAHVFNKRLNRIIRTDPRTCSGSGACSSSWASASPSSSMRRAPVCSASSSSVTSQGQDSKPAVLQYRRSSRFASTTCPCRHGRRGTQQDLGWEGLYVLFEQACRFKTFP